jgi:putative DNA primase/helicase
MSYEDSVNPDIDDGDLHSPQPTSEAEYSDDALALRFTEKHSHEARYTAPSGPWMVWDGKVWVPDSTLRVYDRIRRICRVESAACHLIQLKPKIRSAATVSAVERLARTDRRHTAATDQWDADPWILNTPDGVIDLRRGHLRPTCPGDFITKTTAVARAGDCPTWLNFLSQITNGNQELQDFIQRMCGYALTGLTREHALFFLYGTGANGKSVFLNTIAGVMGDYSKTAPIEAFIASKSEHHPTDLAGLRGARLVTAVETEDGRCWAEAKVKAITGGDSIAARFMRQDFFEYKPQFKLIIVGNHKPRLRSVEEAMRRRFHLLPFTTTIPASERDIELTEKLRPEWGGILGWMIEGCNAWYAKGLTPPPIVVEATASYFTSEDIFAQWLADCCTKDGSSWSPTKQLFESCRRWCDQNQEVPCTPRKFSEALESKGIPAEAQAGGTGFRRNSPDDRNDGFTLYGRPARAAVRSVSTDASYVSFEVKRCNQCELLSKSPPRARQEWRAQERPCTVRHSLSPRVQCV